MTRGKTMDLATLSPEEQARILKNRASSRERYYRNRERYQETMRRWQAENKARAREVRKAWKAANKSRAAANTRRWQKKAVVELSDSYVRTNFAKKLPGLQSKDVPDELIAGARQLMLINRELGIGRKTNEL